MFYFKLLLSCGLLTWVILQAIDLSDLKAAISNVDMKLILLACLMRFLGIMLSSLRWQKLLESQAVRVSLLPLADSYLIASFFNLFLPTRIGGDVFRISDLRHATKSLSRSASAVFVERFLGISILFVFALFASLIQLHLSREIPAVWVGLAIGVCGLLVLFLILCTEIVVRLLGLIPIPRVRENLLSKWQVFQSNTMLLFSQSKPLAWGITYSLLLQINVVIHYWIIGEALGFGVPLPNYFFLIPIQLVVLMLPSINGIGLREASSIVLFSYYGIVATEAATFGFIDLALMLLVGVIGCFRFLTRPSIPKVKQTFQEALSVLEPPN